MNRLKGLSLFSNVGVAEAYLQDEGIDIIIANEIIKERAKFYEELYPKAHMICGDITDNSIRESIINESIEKKIDFIIATPPCQGMSRHGKQEKLDPRNNLIYYVIDVIKKVYPKYILIENVPKLLTTKILVEGELKLIPDYLNQELSLQYNFKEINLFNSENYGVPQSRTRCIYRLIRKDLDVKWNEPKKENITTLKEAIGHLPSIDPLIREEEMRYKFPDYEEKKSKALSISKWNYPPTHSWKHIEWMMHTPSGKTAFYNEHHYPQKEDGKLINGRLSCYRRYSWDKPANTVTQNNGVISSAACVHPGREIVSSPDDRVRVYSDARVLTIYELLIITSLPLDWNIPEWANEKLIRNVIGEGIPPKLIKAIVHPLMTEINNKELTL